MYWVFYLLNIKIKHLIINNIFKHILFNYSMESIIPKYFKRGVHQMLKLSLNLVCQSPGGAQTATLHSPPTPPCHFCPYYLLQRRVNDHKTESSRALTDCFMEGRLSKIKVRVHTAGCPLYTHPATGWPKRAEQGSPRSLLTQLPFSWAQAPAQPEPGEARRGNSFSSCGLLTLSPNGPLFWAAHPHSHVPDLRWEMWILRTQAIWPALVWNHLSLKESTYNMIKSSFSRVLPCNLGPSWQ